jgi:hypothetical protein
VGSLVSLVWGGIQVYQYIDKRFDDIDKELIANTIADSKETISTRRTLVDIQIQMAQAELRALERIDTLNETELRQYRVLEASLTQLMAERSKILGSPQ